MLLFQGKFVLTGVFLAKRGRRKGGVELFCKLIFSIVIKDSIDAILH